MKKLKQNFKRPDISPYRSIFERIEADILSGRMAPGQKLPAIRYLAEQFSVNPNTVQRAFTELKQAGLIFGERGLGSFVTKDTQLIQRCREARTQQLIGELQAQLQALGFSVPEILRML